MSFEIFFPSLDVRAVLKGVNVDLNLIQRILISGKVRQGIILSAIRFSLLIKSNFKEEAVSTCPSNLAVFPVR